MAWSLIAGPQVLISLPLPHDREVLSLFLLGEAHDHIALLGLSAQEVLHVALGQLPEHDGFIAFDQG